MKTCVYDNPNTMARECWQDGKLFYSYSAELISQKGHWPPPRKYFVKQSDIGNWKTGQIVGDILAMLPIEKEIKYLDE